MLNHIVTMLAQAHYLANRGKINAAVVSGLPILDYGGYALCRYCADADHDTMTDADDDFHRVICCNPDCQCHRNQIGGRAGLFPAVLSADSGQSSAQQNPTKE